MSSLHNSIVYERLRDVCPVKNTTGMNMDELLSDCAVAFEVIGYAPKNLEDTVRTISNTRDIPLLFEFVYEVWLNDS